MNLYAGLSTLDPAYASDQSATWMCAQIFNGLLEFDSNLVLQPALCRSWEVGDSGRTYTFHLRDDVWFHKSPLLGPDSTRRMTAADVRYSFTRICNPAVAAKGFWIFNGKVAGVDAYREGKAVEVSGFQVRDDSTFLITLEQPFAPFPNLLAMAYASVVPREVVEFFGKDFRSHPIGTGPFKFKSWNENVSLILLKNDLYFGRDGQGNALPYLDAVHVRFIRERLSEFVELCQGRLDFINGIDKSTKDEIFDSRGQIRQHYRERFKFDINPQLNTEFIGMLVDSTQPAAKGHPLTDRRVRQALNYGIDRQALVDYVLNGNGYPATAGMVPAGMPGFDAAVRGYGYNPDLAAQLLGEAGFPGGKGIPVISLKSTPVYQAAMEFVQKSWERLGLSVTIDNMDGAAVRELASKGEINLWRAGWIADYPDGENYLGLFSSDQIPPNGPNRMRFSNTGFDALFAAAQAEPKDSLRFLMYQEMDRLMLAEAPVVLLYYDKIVRMISPEVTGLTTNAINMLHLTRVRKAS